MTDLTKCENASTGTRSIIVTPRCWNNLSLYITTVNYGNGEQVFELCDGCSEALIRDARKHGYKATRKLHKGRPS
jgi:hypothetical protein